MKKWMTKRMQGFLAQNKDQVVLEPAQDLEELFLQMEDSVKKTERILIKNPADKEINVAATNYPYILHVSKRHQNKTIHRRKNQSTPI